MAFRYRRVKRLISDSKKTDSKSEIFVKKKCALYLKRHLKRYVLLDNETISIVCWVLGRDMFQIGEHLLSETDNIDKSEILEEFSQHFYDAEGYADVCMKMIKKLRSSQINKFHRFILHSLNRQYVLLKKNGKSYIEKNISSLKKLFNLSDSEIEFCTFLFILTTCDSAEHFFKGHLESHRLLGSKYMLNILKINRAELNKISSGTIHKIGMIDFDKYSIEIEDDFLSLFQNPSKQMFEEKFYKKTPQCKLPIQSHFMSNNQTNHIINLLKERPKTSTHILLYGPPGTGKSSFAYGLSKHLGLPSFDIVRDEENTTKNRRAAIAACLNMTNTGNGSLIVVDEADNILNTQLSWLSRGETQDKGWLNQLLEKPGVRMIWVTNAIFGIEESVLRRFSYSVHFKMFNRKQRILLWNNVLLNNRVKRFFENEDIEQFAKKYKVSAGAIDLAIKKAVETNSNSKKKFQRSVSMAIDSHLTLIYGGEKPVSKDLIEKNYSLDGLNIQGNVHAVLNQLEKFDQFLRTTSPENIKNMNLLFYGPPGTGKSELARYIAERLDRELICKRISDIQSMYVGEAEKNIKNAFVEAESEESVLVFDEADSLLFKRERAQRSWEISFTNEFLTQMERFKGILICTTNRDADLDEASIRRFNHKIEFDYLDSKGNIIFYKKLLSPLIKTPLNNKLISSLKKINYLAPGDFKLVRDRFSFYLKKELNHQNFVQALKNEAKIKTKYVKRTTTVGF